MAGRYNQPQPNQEPVSTLDGDDPVIDSRAFATPEDESRPPLPPTPRQAREVTGSPRVLPRTGLLRLSSTEV